MLQMMRHSKKQDISEDVDDVDVELSRPKTPTSTMETLQSSLEGRESCIHFYLWSPIQSTFIYVVSGTK